jgi:hypothetical protein
MQMLAEMKAEQEKTAADRRDDKEERKAFQEKIKAFHEKRMTMLEEQQKRMIACFGQTEARLEYEEPGSGNIQDEQNETKACNEATEKIEENPGMMQSAEEHQDVGSKGVAVMPVKVLKKRRRGRKLIAGRRGEPKKLIRGNCGYRKKLAAACRKVSSGAAVAWLKRNVFRRSGIQKNFGRRKELAIAGIRRTHCAQLVLRKERSHEGTSVEEGRRKNQTKNKFARGTSKSRTPRRRQWATQQGNNRTRKRNPKKHSKRTGTVIQTFGKTTGLKFSERVSRSTVGLRRIRTRTLWRDRPPPKRKKKVRTE